MKKSSAENSENVASKKREVNKVSNRKVSRVNYAFEGDEIDAKSTSTSNETTTKNDFRKNETLHIVAEVY